MTSCSRSPPPGDARCDRRDRSRRADAVRGDHGVARIDHRVASRCGRARRRRRRTRSPTRRPSAAASPALAVWAVVTDDPVLHAAVRGAPEYRRERCRDGRALGRGPPRAQARRRDRLRLAARLGRRPRRSLAAEGGRRRPRGGCRAREGATSAMYALRPGHLVVSLPTIGDTLLDEAEVTCSARGATVIRALGRRPRGLAAQRRHRLPGHGGPCRPDRRRPRARRRCTGLGGCVLRRRAGACMNLGIGVLGCGSVFAGPYAGMISSASGPAGAFG